MNAFDLLIELEIPKWRSQNEVDQVTMTYKKVVSQSLDGVEEVEIKVDDFDRAREFLRSVGLEEKAYQETKRMRYFIEEDNVEFDIDTWPGLEPWIEIEAQSEEVVVKYAKQLGFKWEDAMFGSADFVYARVFNISEHWVNNDCPNLSFAQLPTELLEANRR